MHAQLYIELVLQKCGVPNPELVCQRYFQKDRSPIEKLLKLSLSVYLEKFGKISNISEEERQFVDSWSKVDFPEIDKLPEFVLFRLFRVVQQLGLRVACVFYGMHTMFTICHKFTQERNTLISHKEYVPSFWHVLDKYTRRSQIRQPMMVTISANLNQRLTISRSRLRFFADHSEWLITICNSEILLDDIDGYVLFAKNITFDTCFFKTGKILKHFRRVGNCRFCDVIGSHEHVEWLLAREENCEL